MKKSVFEKLIKEITRAVVQELKSSPELTELMTNDMEDSDTPPEEIMSPAEKARMEREKERSRRDKIKSKEAELDAEKKKMDFQKKDLDRSKRFKIPNLTRDIQSLKK